MKQLDLLGRQREAARLYWQSEAARTSREAEAEAQRRTDSHAVEQNTEKGRQEAAKLLKKVQAAREAAQAELQKAHLPALPDGKTTLVSGEVRVEATKGELEQTAHVAHGRVAELRVGIDALLKHRANVEAAARRRRRLFVIGSIGCLFIVVAGAVAGIVSEVNKRVEATQRAIDDAVQRYNM